MWDAQRVGVDDQLAAARARLIALLQNRLFMFEDNRYGLHVEIIAQDADDVTTPVPKTSY